ncbi:MAG TPA: NUDIX domain-containing protein [Caulobacteraceae bacterium]
MAEARPTPCAGVVCLRPGTDGPDVLLIRRGKPPRLGEWSLPGGHIEWREPAVDAALRELKEETGVEAELLGLLDVVDGLFGDSHYLLVDYAARWISGEVQAGDDAAEAAFWPAAEAIGLVQWSETRRIIALAIERFARAAP